MPLSRAYPPPVAICQVVEINLLKIFYKLQNLAPLTNGLAVLFADKREIGRKERINENVVTEKLL